MKTRYIIISIVLTALISSGFFCSSVSRSGKMGDQFYSYLQNEDYNSIIEMLDEGALTQYSKKEWIQLFTSRSKYFGSLRSYKNTGFHTNTANGLQIAKLSYEVDNQNGLVYEEIEFVKRGGNYKIFTYRFAPDLAALKTN